MNVKKTFCIILLIFILFSTLTIASASDDKTYYINKGYIDLTVENNGLLHVDERYDYTFEGTFNGVYRDIALKPGETVENVKVSAEGAYPVLQESDQNGQKHLKVYLYANKEHTKKIHDCSVTIHYSYDMRNVVTLFNDVGGLHYQYWGKGWDKAVGSIHTTVKLPGDEGIEYFLNPQEYNYTSSLNGDTITAETTRIPKGEFYELVVLMPLDDFDDAPYAKHENQNGRSLALKNLEDSVNSRNFWNMGYLAMGLLSIFSPIGAIITYLKYGREPKVDYDGIYERELPTNDPPEVINALIENKSNIGSPNMRGFEASVMNLIDRKILKIFNEEDASTETKDLVLTFNHAKESQMSPSEKIVFNTLSHFARDNVLNLSRLNGQMSSEREAKWFVNQIGKWEDSVESKIDISHYFNDTGSTIIGLLGLGGIFVGIAIAILGFVTYLSNGIYAVAGGVFLIIFSIIILATDEDIFGRWTEEGRTFYLKWNNFKEFLEDNSLIEEHPPESIVVWKKYLIYGTALGVADEVYESMKLQVPNISDYDDGLFKYHYYGGYGLMNSAFHASQSTINASSSSGSGGFGGLGGGSGGGGGGAF